MMSVNKVNAILVKAVSFDVWGWMLGLIPTTAAFGKKLNTEVIANMYITSIAADENRNYHNYCALQIILLLDKVLV